MLKNISSKTAAAMLGAACACFLAVGCSSSQQIKEEVPDKPPMVLYQETQSIIDTGDFTEAIKYLETMDARYPYGPLSEQIQLDLIYAYYKNGDDEKAIAACDDFIRTHPTHQNLDYVYYMRGLTNMQQDSDLLADRVLRLQHPGKRLPRQRLRGRRAGPHDLPQGQAREALRRCG